MLIGLERGNTRLVDDETKKIGNGECLSGFLKGYLVIFKG